MTDGEPFEVRGVLEPDANGHWRSGCVCVRLERSGAVVWVEPSQVEPMTEQTRPLEERTGPRVRVKLGPAWRLICTGMMVDATKPNIAVRLDQGGAVMGVESWRVELIKPEPTRRRRWLRRQD
jgi:hypothetical protein